MKSWEGGGNKWAQWKRSGFGGMEGVAEKDENGFEGQAESSEFKISPAKYRKEEEEGHQQQETNMM
jgi:hypothetical protein